MRMVLTIGDCCTHHVEAEMDHGGKAAGKSDDCQCLCHQVISHLTGAPVRAVVGALVPMMLTMAPDEFPPDAVPIGIEVPPQLA